MFMQFALEFVNLSENGVLCAVSKEFREAAEGDALWREAYKKRFPKKEAEGGNALQGGPDASPDTSADASAGDDCAGGNGSDNEAAAASPVASVTELSVEVVKFSFKYLYKERIQDPHVSAAL